MAGKFFFDTAHRIEKWLISLWKHDFPGSFQAYIFPLLANMIHEYYSVEHGCEFAVL